MATPILIAFGSNVGDAVGSIQKALDLLGEFVRLEAVSRPVVSAPMYVVDQPSFVNAAAAGETDLGPLALVRRFKDVEQELGRVVRTRNGPREIDIDLIAYGALSYRFGSEVEVPHPRLGERRFVLQPLAEIAPDFAIPGMGTPQELLQRTIDQENFVQSMEDATFSIPGRA